MSPRKVPKSEFHVPPPEDAEELARQQRKAATYAAIVAYIAETEGTGVDLDPALEEASLECLSAL
jgi:hypothetical protein